MKPRADWVCLSKHCKTDDGEQLVYELPVGSTHCPMGHKRLKQLFNRIGVIGLRPTQPDADWRLTSSSALQRSKALLQDSFDERDRLTAAAQATPSYVVGDQEREVSTAKQGKFIMPARAEVIQHFGLAGRGAPMSQLEVQREIKRDRLSVPAVLHELNKKPVPTVVVGQPR